MTQEIMNDIAKMLGVSLDSLKAMPEEILGSMYPLNVVSDDIKRKLMDKGIPESEIAYIHNAKTEKQKSELFDKVRSGEIRVLLGSAIVSSNEQHTD